jgi:hypothetical protein
LLLKWIAIAATAIAIGCGGEHDAASAPAALTDASSPDAGERTGDDELVVFPAQFTEERMPMRMLAEGDPVDLWNAPQGGHVVLVGAKVKNLKSDTVKILARFRRLDNGFILAEDGRTVKMVPVPDEPGFMQPDLRSASQVSNVPLCPSYDGTGIVDEMFEAEVRITALYTDPVQSGEAKMRVVARCSTPDDEVFCRCDCGPDYFLGKCWNTGTDASTIDAPDSAPSSDAGDPDAE